MSRILAVLLGACLLGLMMNSTPGFDQVFRPLRVTAADGSVAHGRLHDAGIAGWQTTDRLMFERYGKPVTRDTQGVFLVVDLDIVDVRESIYLSAVWQGRSGRRYVQTARADGAPGTLDVRQFHPGMADKGRAVFELPLDEVQGGQLLLSRKGVNMLDSELALTPPADAAPRHEPELRMGG